MTFEKTGDQIGVFTVEPGVSEFECEIEVIAETMLNGNDSALLTLTGGEGTNGGSVTTVDENGEKKSVSIAENNCAPGNIVEIEGDGVCRPDQKTAAFIYTVSVDANYGESQSYRYEFAGEKGGFEQGYEFSDLVITVPEGGAVRYQADDDASKGERGEFVVGEGVETFEVTVLATAETKLTGKETLQLKVGDVESDVVGLKELENCVTPVIVEEVKGEGVCVEDGSARNAEFTFGVTLGGAYNQEQEYFYEFSGYKDAGEYELIGLSVVYGESVSPVEPGGEKAGSFVLPAEVSGEFKVLATIRAQEKLTGDEAITLTIDNQELTNKKLHPTNTAKIKNFDD